MEEEGGGGHAKLPDECWETIFGLLVGEDRHNLASVSLVSRKFLSLTNRSRLSLKVSSETIRDLPGLLRRFQYLKSIEIDSRFDGDLNGLIRQISRSGINLESLKLPRGRSPPRDGFRELGSNMKSLKVLDCSELFSLQDKDLILIADCLPWLEELCISCGCIINEVEGRTTRVTDDGVEVLASKLKELRRVVFHGTCSVTDRSFIALSKNCVRLREIFLSSSTHRVTENGIGFVMRNSPKLTSLSLGISYFDPNRLSTIGNSSTSLNSITIRNSIAYAKNLHALSIRMFWHISDELLCSIAEAQLPLKKLELWDIRGRYSTVNKGLPMLLRACQSTLEELTLRDWYLTDSSISDLSIYLHNLTYIYIFGPRWLTSVTFYTITKNCPLLEEIVIKSTPAGEMDTLSPDVLHKNYRVRSLFIGHNEWLDDKTLQNFGLVCPNLQALWVRDCPRLTSLGIGNILKACPAITHLAVSYNLKVSNIFGTYSEHSIVNLMTFNAWKTNIGDEAMVMIGNMCPNLQSLNVGYCKQITKNGVKEVVKNCKRLREIDLLGCENVNIDILAWMVISRPSLKDITPPCGFSPSEELRNIFLSFGCRLRDGEFDSDFCLSQETSMFYNYVSYFF